ncbi:MAG: hypothetical protein A2Y25_05960 [Candidatus Melainabacteria bacterium GWF2_37_15]|nr:MAG: hypothetical protein A2Y25_05960 [Candidatus Melainabacteria bacterium GWF2_37_15]
MNDTTSLLLQRSLATATKNLEVSMVKLSYGKQMTAMEDAANLIISEEMETQRRGSMQAIENAQTGLNMLSTAESGLSSINNNVQRIRELTIQRENGTYSEEDRAAIDAEIDGLTEDITRIAKSTKFNDVNLLEDVDSELSLQVGANADKELNSLNAGEALSGGVKADDLELDRTAPDFLDRIDEALNNINSKRSEIGAMQNRLESTVTSLFVQNENITSAQSRIIDVDVASEVSKLTQNQILQNSSASLMAQANQSAAIASILL